MHLLNEISFDGELLSGTIAAGSPLALALKDNQEAQKQLFDLIQKIKKEILKNNKK